MGEIIGGALVALAVIAQLPTAIGLVGAMASQNAQARAARVMAEYAKRQIKEKSNG